MSKKRKEYLGASVFVKQGKMEHPAFLVTSSEPRGSLQFIEWDSTREREWVQEADIYYPINETRDSRPRRTPQKFQIEEDMRVKKELRSPTSKEQKTTAAMQTAKPTPVAKAAKKSPPTSAKKTSARPERAAVTYASDDSDEENQPARKRMACKSKPGGRAPPRRQLPKAPRILEIEKSVILAQFQKDHPEHNESQCELILMEYLRYTTLKMDHPKILYAPSPLIHAMWQAHILSTRQYFAFLDRYNEGGYIHHDPTMTTDDVERYELTLQAYRDKFGEEPNCSIWPKKLSRTSQVASMGTRGRELEDLPANPRKRRPSGLAKAWGQKKARISHPDEHCDEEEVSNSADYPSVREGDEEAWPETEGDTRFRAALRIKKDVVVHIGRFDTKEEADNAKLVAKIVVNKKRSSQPDDLSSNEKIKKLMNLIRYETNEIMDRGKSKTFIAENAELLRKPPKKTFGASVRIGESVHHIGRFVTQALANRAKHIAKAKIMSHPVPAEQLSADELKKLVQKIRREMTAIVKDGAPED